MSKKQESSMTAEMYSFGDMNGDMSNVCTELSQDEQREFMKANFPGVGEAFLDVPMMVDAGGEIVTATTPLSKKKCKAFMDANFPGIQSIQQAYNF